MTEGLAEAEEVRRRQEEFYTDAEQERYRWLTENPLIRRAEAKLFEVPQGLDDSRSILEVGCGEGANLTTLRRMGITADYTGFDCFEEKVDFCRAHHPEATFLMADARVRFPFDDATFDRVLVRDVLHHLSHEDRINVINESLRTLEPGGVLTIIEGNANNWINRGFATVFEHERCMFETRSHLLEAFVAEVAETHQSQVTMTEPSPLFRLAAHYKFGFPRLAGTPLVRGALACWQGLSRLISPGYRWAYSIVDIKKTADAVSPARRTAA